MLKQNKKMKTKKFLLLLRKFEEKDQPLKVKNWGKKENATSSWCETPILHRRMNAATIFCEFQLCYNDLPAGLLVAMCQRNEMYVHVQTWNR